MFLLFIKHYYTLTKNPNRVNSSQKNEKMITGVFKSLNGTKISHYYAPTPRAIE